MFDLGDTITLTWQDVPNSATSTTVTVTLPDGTVSGPTTVSPVAGTATYNYVTVQSGRHTARWVSSGGVVQAYSDAFDVAETDPGFVISLADVKSQLNMTSSTNDDELRLWLGATTDIVEQYVGAVVPKTYTETHDGGHYTIALYHAPVISVTTVTEYIGLTGYTLTLQPYGSSVDAYGYTIDNPAGGILTRRTSAGFPFPFQGTAGSVTVTYKAGRLIVPWGIQAAARIIVQHLWTTRRGAMPLPANASDAVTVIPGMGYAVPTAAVELLQRHDRQPGIA